MIRVSSSPARPTKGNPWRSSSAPGPSPMNIRSAFGLPEPKTVFCRPSQSRHRRQAATTSAIAPRATARAAASSPPPPAAGPPAEPPTPRGQGGRRRPQIELAVADLAEIAEQLGQPLRVVVRDQWHFLLLPNSGEASDGSYAWTGGAGEAAATAGGRPRR